MTDDAKQSSLKHDRLEFLNSLYFHVKPGSVKITHEEDSWEVLPPPAGFKGRRPCWREKGDDR